LVPSAAPGDISCPSCDIAGSGFTPEFFYTQWQCSVCNVCGICASKEGSVCTIEFDVPPIASNHAIEYYTTADEKSCSKCDSSPVRGVCKECDVCAVCLGRAPICLRVLSSTGRIPVGATVKLAKGECENDDRAVLNDGRCGLLFQDDASDANDICYLVQDFEGTMSFWYKTSDLVIAGSADVEVRKNDDDAEGESSSEQDDVKPVDDEDADENSDKSDNKSADENSDKGDESDAENPGDDDDDAEADENSDKGDKSDAENPGGDDDDAEISSQDDEDKTTSKSKRSASGPKKLFSNKVQVHPGAENADD
jgi:hypothetical protein